MDLLVDPAIEKEFKAAGIGDRIRRKDNYLEGAPYVTFKQAEQTREGKPNKPISVVDILGDPWPQDKLIGNGTDVEVTFVVRDYGKALKKGMYIRTVRVLKHVPYSASNVEPIDKTDPFYAEAAAAQAKKAAEEAQFRKDFGLDDSVDDIGEDEEVV